MPSQPRNHQPRQNQNQASRPSSSSSYNNNINNNSNNTTTARLSVSAHSNNNQTIPPSSSSYSSTSSSKTRQLSHLNAQLAQLAAHSADLDNLLRMTSVQAESIRGLGGYAGAMFMAASKVLGEETVQRGSDDDGAAAATTTTISTTSGHANDVR